MLQPPFQELDDYFEESRTLQIELDIAGMDDGDSIIKEKRIGKDEGDPFSKYSRICFNDASFFGPNEIRFLQSSSIPAMSGFRIQTSQQRLHLSFQLQPNEVRHLHVVRARSVK